MVQLKSADGLTTVEVEEMAALQSNMVKLALEESRPDQCIPLGNVTGPILEKIAEYLRMQSEFASKKPQEIVEKDLPELKDDVAKAEADLKAWKKDVEAWEDQYINVDLNMLFDLILAANYMDIKGLLDLCLEKTASFIRGKTVTEMRETFGIENDLTPEEEEKIQAPYKWAY
ncbi:SKP1-like protein [Rhynchospora pubera]|uniref:SKP1-like protein n=1 Tax=Rhynchospora pubera TaxID=906938 RepID=A0AAV8EEQ3_9POAL|nr:SKP1-like protein [Rhynchospora pubera]